MPKYLITATIDDNYDLEIEADSKEEAVSIFEQIQSDGQVEELAVSNYSYNSYEITNIEETN